MGDTKRAPFTETAAAGSGESHTTRYHEVRAATERLCAPLEIEDYCVQSMPDASPTKWHLAHTSWFFETFLLEEYDPGHRPYHSSYRTLFNSYYEAVGPQHPRPRRGLLTRPTVDEVFRYRSSVDERISALLQRPGHPEELWARLELGMHHERQHQELLLTDIKHAFSCNPLRPAYRTSAPHSTASEGTDFAWCGHDGGVFEVGHEGASFSYDNERPRHEVLVRPFELASRLVTNHEFLEFIEDGGYRRPELWLSDGWVARRAGAWTCPAYWEGGDGAWRLLTLDGMRELEAHVPVCHVSFFEADAYARWRGARLPSEQEWELMAARAPIEGNFLERGALHPLPATRSTARSGPDPRQMFGDAWEWTSSPYLAYPGYTPEPGAVGEYNGKFMCNQFVLRGGSCATPGSHVRATYRNFFPAPTRWQFAGFRLARDA